MFTRIVVGTDGSETAARSGAPGDRPRQALRRDAQHRQRLRAGLQAPRRQASRLDAPADIQYEIGPREDVNLVLEAAAADAKKEGVEAQTHPVEGEPAEAILNVAEQTKADLIVVGNKGMSGARRFLLGSVPNNVSHHAPCSVIIVRTT